MTDLNPQREQMSDESMVRNLAAQAIAIWPQEVALFRRYGLPPDIRILDGGCGTGEITSRLAEIYPLAKVLGVDVLDHHLARARERYAHLAPRVTFEHQSLFVLPAADATYDLAVCRHVVQSVPRAERVIAELKRVTRPGGVVHVIAEDYDMIHFATDAPGIREFWQEAPGTLGAKTGTDLFVGRHAWSHFTALGFEDVTVDYVVVDTVRVPRETFAAIFTAWRDGYVDAMAELTGSTREEVLDLFDRTIASIRDPRRYAVWMVPVVAGRVPAR